MTSEQYLPPKPAFNRKQIYTEAEIQDIATAVDDPTDYEETIFLIANAPDGREYWFVDNGEGWVVSHSWQSYMLSGGRE